MDNPIPAVPRSPSPGALFQQLTERADHPVRRLLRRILLPNDPAPDRQIPQLAPAFFLLGFHHRHQAPGDGFPVGDMVQRPDGMGESMDVSGQLPVDGVAAIVRRQAHLLARVNILRIFQHPGLIFQHQAHAFPTLAEVFSVGTDVGQQTFQAVAEGIDAAPDSDVSRRGSRPPSAQSRSHRTP